MSAADAAIIQQILDDESIVFEDILSMPPSPPPAPKRRRPVIEVPECPVCLDLAVPPVVLDCDHIMCGPCVRELEGTRPVRSARFACPQCRRRVLTYTVPTVFRDAAYQAADDDQRTACDAFMQEYRDTEPQRPVSSTAVVDQRIVDVLNMIPRQLTAAPWHHDGTKWTLNVANAFAETSEFRSADRKSTRLNSSH